ncbi:MAG: exonuclease domain-containing protein [Clostridia bacterium]|nr:exonuclease domain-containing protein [Clostridia bacterium]
MYIVLDLEWNQLFPGQSGIPNREGMILRTEIIQIGAVKLDAAGDIVDSFSTLVCPVGKKPLNPNITKVTGLRREMLKDSPFFPEAVERLRAWCGEDPVFLSWGRDDLPVFLSNLQYHGYPFDFCENWYDAQPIFARQNELPRQQYSLMSAAEFYSLETEAIQHDALNDAMYAARICQKLDLEKGIRDAGRPEKIPQETVDSGLFPTDRSAVRKGMEMRYVCPACERELVQVRPFVRKNQHRFLTLANCPEHGEQIIQIRCWANGKAHWKLAWQVEKASEEDKNRYEKMRERVLRHVEAVRKRRESGPEKGKSE